MADETQKETTQVIEPTPAPVKRGRGRPKGSKNKPKDPNAPSKEPKAVKPVTVSATPAVAKTLAPVVSFVPVEDDIVESAEEVEDSGADSSED